MVSAEIITIGTEILLGEIVDTNAATLARSLRLAGINLFRKTSVGDNPARIAAILQEALSRVQVIITTGGLGPTVDDPTREAVALALGVDLEFRPELWDQILERFQRYGRQPTENNRKQAYIPRGSQALENPVGTAPCFIATVSGEQEEKVIISLPGVPREMEYLLEKDVIPFLVKRFTLTGTIKTRVLHTAGTGESQIDSLIGDLEQLSNPTVGLAAHSGQVDVRITARADSEAEADLLIAPVEADLRKRLGKWVYGADEDSLEGAAMQALARRGWTLAAAEANTGGELLERLFACKEGFLGGVLTPSLESPEALLPLTEAARSQFQADAALGVALFQKDTKFEVHGVLITPAGVTPFTRSYGGPPGYAPRYAVHHSLSMLARMDGETS
jgi:competence/damage-inducible protein CinA-like protein